MTNILSHLHLLDANFTLIVVGLITVFLLLFYLSRHLSKSNFGLIPLPDKVKAHHWVYVEAFPAGKYCNVCETSLFHGGECDYCGILADDECIRRADAAITCKSLAAVPASSMKHHWIHGNLPMKSLCEVCETPCGDGPGLQDFRCVWCLYCVHKDCMASYTSICDFGKLKRLIIPPSAVKLRQVGWKGARHFVVKDVVPPPLPDWAPLIVIANRRSGNGDGDAVLQAFRRLLNPAQVLDLASAPPERGLEWCRLLGDVRCRILVAGGDGTVGWVLESLEALALDPSPGLCLLPLGTGNDLSRVLGWGPGHSGPIDAMEVLGLLEAATPVALDRWAVAITERPGPIQLRRAPKERHLTMSGYLSLGVDAQVTLNFHQRRFALPSAVAGRLANKLLFFHYGTRDLVDRACASLEAKLELWLDGLRVRLPPLEGLVVQNIATWGAGVRPWELCWCGEAHPLQAMDDGRLEVMGLSSSFHIAQIQVGLSEPIRLGQAAKVEILIKETPGVPALPMQVDGEPWLQRPGRIVISYKCQVFTVDQVFKE